MAEDEPAGKHTFILKHVGASWTVRADFFVLENDAYQFYVNRTDAGGVNRTDRVAAFNQTAVNYVGRDGHIT